MSEKVTSEAIYEVLKTIQDDVSYIKAQTIDHSEQLAGLRTDLATLRRVRAFAV